jgi:hypothetical protein
MRCAHPWFSAALALLLLVLSPALQARPFEKLQLEIEELSGVLNWGGDRLLADRCFFKNIGTTGEPVLIGEPASCARRPGFSSRRQAARRAFIAKFRGRRSTTISAPSWPQRQTMRRASAVASPPTRIHTFDARRGTRARSPPSGSSSSHPRQLIHDASHRPCCPPPPGHARLLNLTLANTALHEPGHFIANLDDVADFNESMKGESHVAFPAPA